MFSALEGLDPCHRLHYLQMSTEKLSKALLLSSRAMQLEDLRASHKVFVKFLRVAGLNQNVQRALGVRTLSDLHARLRGLTPLAAEIERRSPQVAGNGPNSEYPWGESLNDVVTPADFNFPVLEKLSSPKGERLMKLVERLLEEFNMVSLRKEAS